MQDVPELRPLPRMQAERNTCPSRDGRHQWTDFRSVSDISSNDDEWWWWRKRRLWRRWRDDDHNTTRRRYRRPWRYRWKRPSDDIVVRYRHHWCMVLPSSSWSVLVTYHLTWFICIGYSTRMVSYVKTCMLIFKCLKAPAPASVVFCTKGSAASEWSAFGSAVRGDLVVPSHRTDWRLRAFAVAGPRCWNELPVELRNLPVGPETFAKHLKTHWFRFVFGWITQVWVCLKKFRVRYQVQ